MPLLDSILEKVEGGEVVGGGREVEGVRWLVERGRLRGVRWLVGGGRLRG